MGLTGASFPHLATATATATVVEPAAPRMWDHFCQNVHGLMSTAAGKDCSWCGAREGDR